MGEVWRAYDSEIDRVVALKMLLPHLTEDPDFEKRFRREVRAAARLDDRHVVPIYDVGEIDGRLYVTMRLIAGTDLNTLLDSGPLDPQRAVKIIEQIAAALHNAHVTGLVHRDVKPSNILLDDNDFAYLIDFGIARTAEDGVTQTGAAIGTWAYMAPERFSTDEIHPSSDIYALACVLYECVTGQQPFPGNTLEKIASGHIFMPPPRPSEISRTVPTALDEVIATGLAKTPSDRYPTAIDMASAAREVIIRSSQPNVPRPMPTPAPKPPSVSQGAPPSPPMLPQQAWRQPHSSAPVGALVFITTLIVVAGVIAVVGFTSRDDPSRTSPSAATPRGGEFTGTYTADYGPGTDLEDKPVPNAPAKWTRNEAGTMTCASGGTAQVTITAEYPMPPQLDDPISVLTGRGSQTVSAGGDCAGGGDFTDTFERTGD
jgi:serine/threonine protein kinase